MHMINVVIMFYRSAKVMKIGDQNRLAKSAEIENFEFCLKEYFKTFKDSIEINFNLVIIFNFFIRLNTRPIKRND